MPGQGTVTIDDRQWAVSLATTPAELSQGLGGVASIPAGTGMLFDVGVDQVIEVTTEPMLFAIDIIWIHSTQGVVEVARDIGPGYLVTPTVAARYFLEVNAGEAEGVEAGDSVSIDITAAPGGGVGWIQSIVGPVVVLGVLGMVMKGFLGSEHRSSGVRRLGGPRTEEERREAHGRFYGTREVPPRGTGLAERREETAGRRKGEPKTEEERRERHESIYGTSETPPRGTGRSSGEERRVVRFIGACKVVDGYCQTHGRSVSETLRCPGAPLTDKEWQAAYELVKMAYPEGQPNPWVNGWWPESMEEALGAARRYEDSLWGAFRRYEGRSDVAVDQYRRAARRASATYRDYVVREYERGRELGPVATQRTSIGGNGTCGDLARPLFEKAAVAHYWSLHDPTDSVESAEEAGATFARAAATLYGCLGIRSELTVALQESHRWYSFFNLWYAARLLQREEPREAAELLRDQTEEEWTQSALREDYGSKAEELYENTLRALSAAEEGRVNDARFWADSTADAYYSLAIGKAGTHSEGGPVATQRTPIGALRKAKEVAEDIEELIRDIFFTQERVSPTSCMRYQRIEALVDTSTLTSIQQENLAAARKLAPELTGRQTGVKVARFDEPNIIGATEGVTVYISPVRLSKRASMLNTVAHESAHIVTGEDDSSPVFQEKVADLTAHTLKYLQLEPEDKEQLVREYGVWAASLAEAMVPLGDVERARAVAGRLVAGLYTRS